MTVAEIAVENPAAGDVIAHVANLTRDEPPIHRELAALARLRGDDVTAAREHANAERAAAAIRPSPGSQRTG